MSDHNASCSDLDLAQILSWRLATPGAAAEPPPQPPYAGFSAAFAPQTPAAQPQAVTAGISPRRFETWDDLLIWALAANGAASGFVMDPEGFAIAAQGSIDVEQAQALGVHLMVALSEVDQPEYPGARAVSIAVEYPPFTLTGMRVARADGAVFTLGLTATDYLTAPAREALRAHSAFNLQHL